MAGSSSGAVQLQPGQLDGQGIDPNLLQKLEQASNTILASPSAEQRHAAEQFLLDFRKTKNPYTVCCCLMEQTRNDYVIFQCACTLKEAILREWAQQSPTNVHSLRDFLMQFVLNRPSLPVYVREEIVLTVAVIVKRGTLDSSADDRNHFISQLTKLIHSDNAAARVVGLSTLSALLAEYGGNGKGTDFGLSWEFHLRCKKVFEDKELLTVFMVLLEALQQLSALEGVPSDWETLALIGKLLALAEQIFTWRFSLPLLQKRFLNNMSEARWNSPFRPPSQWRELVVGRGLVIHLFKLYRHVQSHAELAHVCLQCLLQLVSTTGDVFPDHKTHADFLIPFMAGFLHLTQRNSLAEYEVLGVATLACRLLTVFPRKYLGQVPSDQLQAFLTRTCQLTCSYSYLAMHQKAAEEESLYDEGLEQLLQMWTALWDSRDSFPPAAQLCQTFAPDIFQTYLQSHLATADGTAAQAVSSDDMEEIRSEDEDDRERYSAQLCHVGMLGRTVPAQAISQLTGLLCERISQLQLELKDSAGTQAQMNRLYRLYDDLHWLLLIAGHLLADQSEGEALLIPTELMDHSISQAQMGVSEVGATQSEMVCSLHIDRMSQPTSDKCDDIVRLVCKVFMLSELERYAVQAQLDPLLSPELSRDIVWFFQRWAGPYLLMQEKHYPQVSLPLTCAFGQGSDSASLAVQTLVSKVVSNFQVWTSEGEVTEDTVQLLLTLTENRDRCLEVVKCEKLWFLAMQQFCEPFMLLAANCRRHLMKAVLFAASAMSSEVRARYWTQTMQPLHDRFQVMVQRRGSGGHAGLLEARNLLELLCGVAEAARVDNTSLVFSTIYPRLRDSVGLMDAFHNYPEIVVLVLDAFKETITRQLCYLSQEDSLKLYEVTIQLIRSYARHHGGRGVTVDASAEEDDFNDLMLLLDMLTQLINKDFVDFGSTDDGAGEPSVAPADVVFCGLDFVVPLMSAELLKFPSLCLQYYQLVSLLCEVYPERVPQLPQRLFSNIMASLQLGLSSDYGEDVQKLCLDTLECLAIQCVKSGSTAGQSYQALQHFVQVVLDMLVLQPLNPDLLDVLGETFYALICCHQAQYAQLVHQLVRSQADTSTAERLAAAFHRLTPPDIPLNLEKTHRSRFEARLQTFVMEVRSIMTVR
ncbi:exportin-4-like [Branchiostoma lanceolatum]|uniref:exportin-4-like n=1 Tax=Branchiostoma lanceolatum TaxID=7740 RepID=UPI003454DCFC